MEGDEKQQHFFDSHQMQIVFTNTAFVLTMSYLARHPTLRTHPSPIGRGWELIDGRCRPVRHTRPALPIHLPAPMPSGESDEMESDDEEESDSHALGKMTECSSESDSDYSEAECFDMD